MAPRSSLRQGQRHGTRRVRDGTVAMRRPVPPSGAPQNRPLFACHARSSSSSNAPSSLSATLVATTTSRSCCCGSRLAALWSSPPPTGSATTPTTLAGLEDGAPQHRAVGAGVGGHGALRGAGDDEAAVCRDREVRRRARAAHPVDLPDLVLVQRRDLQQRARARTHAASQSGHRIMASSRRSLLSAPPRSSAPTVKPVEPGSIGPSVSSIASSRARTCDAVTATHTRATARPTTTVATARGRPRRRCPPPGPPPRRRRDRRRRRRLLRLLRRRDLLPPSVESSLERGQQRADGRRTCYTMAVALRAAQRLGRALPRSVRRRGRRVAAV